jgi:murein DD-endopeptidase MepM/ murein hydrolase activator NlpD
MKDESRLIFISKDQKKYKEFKISRVKLFTYISVFLIFFLISGKVGLDFLINFSHNSKIERLERTNTVLETRLKEMAGKIENISSEIDRVASLDDQLRTVLGLDKISSEVRKVGIGGSNFEVNINDEIVGFDENFELSEHLTELSQLEREVKLEHTSYTDLYSTFYHKQDSLAYLPALRPVLKGVISSDYGMRMHPVLKVRRHHDGIDISAKLGTPVYATADGEVRFADWNSGYGKMVMVNHKYGFETRYGHLSKIVVRKGQTVKRGEKIGEVGNTGLTTASHLHYEVQFHGKTVDPKYYYFDDKILNELVVQN